MRGPLTQTLHTQTGSLGFQSSQNHHPNLTPEVIHETDGVSRNSQTADVSEKPLLGMIDTRTIQ